MLTPEQRRECIQKIRDLPDQLESAVAGLSEQQLVTPYLPGEWTVAQNVHHLADTHMSLFIRMKLILTEDRPPLKPLDQDVWAAMPDGRAGTIHTSLLILRGLHSRWADMLEPIPEAAWQRVGLHPERGEQSLDRMVQVYSGHGLTHIQQIRQTLAAAPA